MTALPAPKLFISHASGGDAWVAQQLARQARACGVETFLDCEDIAYGDDFEDRIIAAAEQCSELLVLFTPTAKDRKYVWMEIGMFLGARKTVVAALYNVRKEDISTDQLIPVALKRIHMVELSEVHIYFEQLKTRMAAPRLQHE